MRELWGGVHPHWNYVCVIVLVGEVIGERREREKRNGNDSRGRDFKEILNDKLNLTLRQWTDKERERGQRWDWAGFTVCYCVIDESLSTIWICVEEAQNMCKTIKWTPLSSGVMLVCLHTPVWYFKTFVIKNIVLMTSAQCETHVAHGRYVHVDHVVHELKEEEQASDLELGEGLWCQAPFTQYKAFISRIRIHIGTIFDHLKQLTNVVWSSAAKQMLKLPMGCN